jgi:hypothetical protein
LRLAQTQGGQSLSTLTAAQTEGSTHQSVKQQAKELKQAAESWMTSLASMQMDLQCEAY